MKRIKIITILLVLVIAALCFLPREISAESETLASGTCGEALTWVLDGNGILTVSGTGTMTDFGYCESPWYDYGLSIKKVIIEDGVTSIGDEAFSGMLTNLTEVSIPNSVAIIGNNAFDTSGLTSVNIPEGVRPRKILCNRRKVTV